MLIRLIKFVLFLVSVKWAVYSSAGFETLARIFPASPPQHEYGFLAFLADLQGYSVVYGPAIVAGIFLMIEWPKKNK